MSRSTTVYTKPDVVDRKNGIEECGLIIPVGSLTAHSTPTPDWWDETATKVRFRSLLLCHTSAHSTAAHLEGIVPRRQYRNIKNAVGDKLSGGSSIQVSGRRVAVVSFASIASKVLV